MRQIPSSHDSPSWTCYEAIVGTSKIYHNLTSGTSKIGALLLHAVDLLDLLRVEQWIALWNLATRKRSGIAVECHVLLPFGTEVHTKVQIIRSVPRRGNSSYIFVTRIRWPRACVWLSQGTDSDHCSWLADSATAPCTIYSGHSTPVLESEWYEIEEGFQE